MPDPPGIGIGTDTEVGLSQRVLKPAAAVAPTHDHRAKIVSRERRREVASAAVDVKTMTDRVLSKYSMGVNFGGTCVCAQAWRSPESTRCEPH
ncbi:hypothetical protein MPUL_09370 [Mycolicibacterium pulveris]|uniref:Uncharacterized protein n=1 Tax=Mycolicibacterium pulveris TaxID=36813 RepID=A0A7I7UGH4_MYCPV|nr:hypothetical protein MPUL_09370 [Mycolicibacterium pulveris]